MKFNGELLAAAWRAVALASSSDPDRPEYGKTMRVEDHDYGVRLIATDSYMILHAWVPAWGNEDEDPPAIDEAPRRTATVIDEHDRGLGVMNHASKLAKRAAKEGGGAVELSLYLNVSSPTSEQPTLGDMAPRYARIERAAHPLEAGTERLILPVFMADVDDDPVDDHPSGAWLDWRAVMRRQEPVKTEVVSLAPQIMKRLATAGTIMPHVSLGFVFGGTDRPVRVEFFHSNPSVYGVAMPRAWDWERGVPLDADELGDLVDDDGVGGIVVNGELGEAGGDGEPLEGGE